LNTDHTGKVQTILLILHVIYIHTEHNSTWGQHFFTSLLLPYS